MSSNLTPKKITDKNGRQTTVYVKEGMGISNLTNGKSPDPNSMPDSFEQKLRDFEPQPEERETYEALLRASDDEKVTIRFNEQLPSGGTFQALVGDGQESDTCVEGTLVRNDGTKVFPLDTGSYTKIVTTDGQARKGWFAPHVLGDDFYPEKTEVTDQEWSELEDIAELRDTTYVGNATTYAKILDPEMGPKDYIAREIILRSREYGGITPVKD